MRRVEPYSLLCLAHRMRSIMLLMDSVKSASGLSSDAYFDLDAAAFSNDEFRVYQFKVKRCPRAQPHDWTQVGRSAVNSARGCGLTDRDF